MSEIKVGDLVQVVRPMPCCGDASPIGMVFIVRWIGVAFGPCECCGDHHPSQSLSWEPGEYGDAVGIAMVIKIDPPATGDEVSTRVPLTTGRKQITAVTLDHDTSEHRTVTTDSGN